MKLSVRHLFYSARNKHNCVHYLSIEKDQTTCGLNFKILKIKICSYDVSHALKVERQTSLYLFEW